MYVIVRSFPPSPDKTVRNHVCQDPTPIEAKKGPRPVGTRCFRLSGHPTPELQDIHPQDFLPYPRLLLTTSFDVRLNIGSVFSPINGWQMSHTNSPAS